MEHREIEPTSNVPGSTYLLATPTGPHKSTSRLRCYSSTPSYQAMAATALASSVTLVGGVHGLQTGHKVNSLSSQQGSSLFGGTSVQLKKSAGVLVSARRSQHVSAACGPYRFSNVRGRSDGRRRRTEAAFGSPWGAFELMPGVVMGGCGPQPLNYRGGQMGNLTQFLATLMREVPRTMGLRGWDVRESNIVWTLRIDLPGYGPEDVDVEVADNILNITANLRNQEEETSETQSRFSTRTSSNFSTKFPLPDTIQVDGIGAEVDRGVLTITLPKIVAKQPKRTVVTVKVKGDGTSQPPSSDVNVAEAKKMDAGFEPGEDTSRWDALDAEDGTNSAGVDSKL